MGAAAAPASAPLPYGRQGAALSPASGAANDPLYFRRAALSRPAPLPVAPGRGSSSSCRSVPGRRADITPGVSIRPSEGESERTAVWWRRSGGFKRWWTRETQRLSWFSLCPSLPGSGPHCSRRRANLQRGAAQSRRPAGGGAAQAPPRPQEQSPILGCCTNLPAGCSAVVGRGGPGRPGRAHAGRQRPAMASLPFADRELCGFRTWKGGGGRGGEGGGRCWGDGTRGPVTATGIWILRGSGFLGPRSVLCGRRLLWRPRRAAGVEPLSLAPDGGASVEPLRRQASDRGSPLAMGGAGESEHGGQRRPWRRSQGGAGRGACAGRAADGWPSPRARGSPNPGSRGSALGTSRERRRGSAVWGEQGSREDCPRAEGRRREESFAATQGDIMFRMVPSREAREYLSAWEGRWRGALLPGTAERGLAAGRGESSDSPPPPPRGPRPRSVLQLKGTYLSLSPPSSSLFADQSGPSVWDDAWAQSISHPEARLPLHHSGFDCCVLEST